MSNKISNWYKTGSPWVWLNAGAVAISVILVVGLLSLIAVRGLGHFWPGQILVADYAPPGQESRLIAGEISDTETVSASRLEAAGLSVPEGMETLTRDLLKVGNRDVSGSDFAWVIDLWLEDRRYPENIVALERREWGNFYGYLTSIKQNGNIVADGDAAWPEFQKRLDRALSIYNEIYAIEKHEIGSVNSKLERLRLEQRGLELNDKATPQALASIEAQRKVYQAEYKVMEAKLGDLYVAFNRDSLIATTIEGTEIEQSFGKIVRAYKPNAMTLTEKIFFYLDKVGEFITDDPREANTEGGVFPAIFGTVMMVILMSIIVTPFGVIAAVYLREYASQGWLTRAIRIAVNNLAGVPSIVYGVFGLGFFIYFAGGQIDQLSSSRKLYLDQPLVRQGLLWASITSGAC